MNASQQPLEGQCLSIIPSYRWRNWGTEQRINLPRILLWVCSGARIWTEMTSLTSTRAPGTPGTQYSLHFFINLIHSFTFCFSVIDISSVKLYHFFLLTFLLFPLPNPKFFSLALLIHLVFLVSDELTPVSFSGPQLAGGRPGLQRAFWERILIQVLPC